MSIVLDTARTGPEASHYLSTPIAGRKMLRFLE